ncbi:uncharacterized protein LOC128473653 [Spea bombifrons]|uniref:uncharacterized protein LOC128473653 n=1 Tax=Spea bombifrons TaxID=233779 RepID=UPI002349DDD6|nr:uncharacterized protein LOC128473653 [Spea bombifrons]
MAEESQTQMPAAVQAWLRSALAASLPAALEDFHSARPSSPLASPTGVEDSEAGGSSSPPATAASQKRTWGEEPSTSGKGKAPLKKARSSALPLVSPNDDLTDYEVIDEYCAGSSGPVSPMRHQDCTPDLPKLPLIPSNAPDQPFEVTDDLGTPLFDPRALRHPRSSEWTPSSHIAEFLRFWMRRPLDKEVRQRLRSECPRPTVRDKVLNTPEFDPTFVTFLTKTGKDPRKGIELGLRSAQDKLLDVSGPLTQVFQMADEAIVDGSPLDPHLVRDWTQRALCLLGNANCAISSERRKAALFKLDAKLAELGPKELGADAKGLLFGERFIKDISQHVNLFTSLNKAQTNIRRVFRTESRFSPRAGRQRGRAASRTASFGSRPRFPDASTSYRSQSRIPFSRGVSRGRGYTSTRGRSASGRPPVV